ncbi:hypothetical protein C8J56DRAFT_742417, partial [Mycena floridula]
DFSPKEISTLLAMPTSTVYRLLECEPGSFDVQPPPRTGQLRNLSHDDVGFLLDVIEAQPDIYLDELKEELELQGIKISLGSLCRCLHRNGISHKQV